MDLSSKRNLFRSSGRTENVCVRMTHTLVELSVASAGHGRVITAVHFGDVVALYVGYLVHGQVAGKGHLTEGRLKTTCLL